MSIPTRRRRRTPSGAVPTLWFLALAAGACAPSAPPVGSSTPAPGGRDTAAIERRAAVTPEGQAAGSLAVRAQGPSVPVVRPAEAADTAAAEALVAGARDRLGTGDAVGALDLLVRFPNGTDAELRARAVKLARLAASAMAREELGAVLRATPLGWPLIGTVQAAYARALRLAGQDGAARRFAEAALALGATGEDAEAARTIIRETRPEAGGAEVRDVPVTAVTLGALLPGSGSPALQRIAGGIEEGIRAALAAPDAPRAVELEIRDEASDPATAAAQMRALEEGPLVGVIGPLQPSTVQGAAAARSRPLVMVSPTASEVSDGEGVYSLATPDPGAARALARYAFESGVDQVVVLHPREEPWVFEAGAFREAFVALGGSVLRVLSYEAGSTYFQEQLRQAEALAPQALVLPAPARDIEALAPQVSFFGLDTLGIRVLGTSEWADDALLRSVAPRHMNGTVVATSQRSGPETEGHRRFRETYEQTFQRTLRDDVPALGYDAASLLLLAVRTGARTPEGLHRAMEGIRGFEGATGVLSVEDGRIVREHYLVCVQDGALVEVRPGELPVQFRPMRDGDPEEGEPERVPMGPVQRYCPGHVPADVLEALRGDARSR